MPPPNTPEDDEDDVPELVQATREPIRSTLPGGDHHPAALLETFRRMQSFPDDQGSPSSTESEIWARDDLPISTRPLIVQAPQAVRQTHPFFSSFRAPPVSETSASSGSQTPEPPAAVDWEGLEYTGAVDDNLICPICKTPFANPHTTRACGHTFCKHCIDHALRLQPACPICRTHMQPGSAVRCPLIIFGLLDKLEVKCPNGLCAWAGCRSSLVAHVDQCPFTPLPCPDRHCERKVIRKDAAVGKCLHHVGSCMWCRKPVEMAKLEEHCRTACEGYTEKCDACHEIVCLYEKDLHDSQCQQTAVDCAYASIGCTARCRRADMPLHEQACPHGVFKRLEDHHRAEMNQARDRIMQEMEVAMQVAMRRKEREVWAQLEEHVDHVLSVIKNQALQNRADRAEQHHHPHPDRSAEHRRVPPRPGPPPTAGAQNRAAPAAGTPPRPENGGGAAGEAEGPHCANCDARDEYMFSMFADLEARISSLVSTVSEQDARHYAMLVNEVMPLKEQLAEARSQQGVVGMHVRWLMDLQRQRRATDRQNINGAAAAAAVANMSEAAASGGGRAASAASSTSAGGSAGGDGSGAGQATRRLSERMMNPPRL